MRVPTFLLVSMLFVSVSGCGADERATLPDPEPPAEEPEPEEPADDPVPEATDQPAPVGAGCQWSDVLEVDFGAPVLEQRVGQNLVAARDSRGQWRLRRWADGELVEAPELELDAVDALVPWGEGNLVVAGPTLRRIDAVGTLGEPLRAATDHSGDFHRGWLAVSSDRALLAWAQITRDRTDYLLRGTIIELDDWTLGDPFTIGSLALGRSVFVAAHRTGFVAVWESLDDNAEATLHRAVIAGSGDVTASEIPGGGPPEPSGVWRVLPGVLGDDAQPVIMSGMSLRVLEPEARPLLDVRPESRPHLFRLGQRDVLAYDHGIGVRFGTVTSAGVESPYTVAEIGEGVEAATLGQTVWLAFGASGGPGPVLRVLSAECR